MSWQIICYADAPDTTALRLHAGVRATGTLHADVYAEK